jgi:S-adenosylmethionine hydrolase
MEPPPYILSAPRKDAGTTPGVKVITLFTDFGLKDPYVGIMKGVILSINPEATIIDITHDITPQDIEEGALLIEEYHRFFPPGTIHVAVIDPTVGSERRPIIVSKDNNVFIGPDNGLFTLILDDAEVYLIENPDFMLKEVSSTFHGRDIFAPAAAHASTGFHPSAFGRIISDPICLDNMFPTKEGHSLKGRIVHFDRFGNAITNIKIDFLKDFLGNQSFEVRVGGMTFAALSKSYYESEFTCLIGSSGYLEFGYFKGSFKEKGNVAKNDSVLIHAL